MTLQYKNEDGEIYAYESEETLKLKKELRYNINLEKSGIPKFYWNINFENYKGDKANKEYLYIEYYANNCHKKEFNHIHLFLYGNHSTQKSALMYNICKQAIKNEMKVKTILAGTLIDKLMKLQGFNFIQEIYDDIQELKNCDLLAIDDIFDIEKSLMWGSNNKTMIISEWDQFLREVLASKTKIITTSNYDKNNIRQHFGKSISELIDRNFFSVQLTESIKELRQYNVSKIFDNINIKDKNE